jgi:hypothetical protein
MQLAMLKHEGLGYLPPFAVLSTTLAKLMLASPEFPSQQGTLANSDTMRGRITEMTLNTIFLDHDRAHSMQLRVRICGDLLPRTASP